MVVKAGAEAAS